MDKTHLDSHNYKNIHVADGGNAVLGNTYNFYNAASAGHAKAFLDELAYPEMQARYEGLREPYPDTFKWIFDEPDEDSAEESWQPRPWDSFADWMESGSLPYWISGKLGTGKSTLMKFIVEELMDRAADLHETVIHHFFWEPGSELQRSLLGCVRSLICQLWPVVSSKSPPQALNVPPSRSLQKLQRYLVTLISQCKHRVIILLDGLDECRETDEVLDLVDTLSGMDSVKLCIASRPEQAYVQCFSRHPKLKLQDLNREDIEKVVRKELCENPRPQLSMSWNTADAESLVSAVVYKAEGVFLWARLVTKDLLRGWTNCDDMQSMLDRLHKLPVKINELYSKMLQQNDENSGYEEDAAFYFNLLTQSDTNKMSLLAFHFAVNETLRQRWLDFDKVFDVDIRNVETDLDCQRTATWANVRSAGMLEVRSDIQRMHVDRACVRRFNAKPLQTYGHLNVGFIHRSVLNFLRDTADGQRMLCRSAKTQAELAEIYFYCQVLRLLVVPALYGYCYDTGYISRLWPCTEVDVSIYRVWFAQLHIIYDHLYRKGLIQLTGIIGEDREVTTFFRSPKHATIDLYLAAAVSWQSGVRNFLLDECNGRNPDAYTSTLIVMMIGSSIWHGLDIAPLLSILSDCVSRIRSAGKTQDRHNIYNMFKLATTTCEDSSDAQQYWWSIWSWLQTHFRDFDHIFVPSPREVVGLVCDFYRPPRRTLVMSVSLTTAKALSGLGFGRCDDQPSGEVMPHFFVTLTSEAVAIRIVRKDHHAAIRCIVYEMISGKNSLLPVFALRVGLVMIALNRGKCASRIDRMLQSIHEDCQPVGSILECLQQMKYNEAEIAEAVQCEIYKAQRVAPLYSDEVQRWRFRRLLGRDPAILSGWCERFPELADCLAEEEMCHLE